MGWVRDEENQGELERETETERLRDRDTEGGKTRNALGIPLVLTGTPRLSANAFTPNVLGCVLCQEEK